MWVELYVVALTGGVMRVYYSLACTSHMPYYTMSGDDLRLWGLSGAPSGIEASGIWLLSNHIIVIKSSSH